MSTVTNVGDPKAEDLIREQLDLLEKENPMIRTTVLGSSDNDDLEVKVENRANGKSWCAKLTLPNNKTAEKVVEFARKGVASVR